MVLYIECEDVVIKPETYFLVKVTLNNVKHKEDIIKQFKIKDVIDTFHEEKILDVIGVRKVKEYFDLKNNDDIE